MISLMCSSGGCPVPHCQQHTRPSRHQSETKRINAVVVHVRNRCQHAHAHIHSTTQARCDTHSSTCTHIIIHQHAHTSSFINMHTHHHSSTCTHIIIHQHAHTSSFINMHTHHHSSTCTHIIGSWSLQPSPLSVSTTTPSINISLLLQLTSANSFNSQKSLQRHNASETCCLPQSI